MLGALQWWLFLVALLADPTSAHFTAWMEFKQIEPEEVAGEHTVYKFVCQPEPSSLWPFRTINDQRIKAKFDRLVSEEDTVPLSHVDESPANLPELAGPARPFGPGVATPTGPWQLLPGHPGAALHTQR